MGIQSLLLKGGVRDFCAVIGECETLVTLVCGALFLIDEIDLVLSFVFSSLHCSQELVLKNTHTRSHLGHFSLWTAALGAALSFGGYAHAQEASPTHSHAHSGEEAHVHGVVALDVALDGHDLVVALHAPLADIVGFEHTPSSEVQHAQVAVARAKLEDTAEWLKPSAAAQCRIERIDLAAPVLGWSAEPADGHSAGHGQAPHAHTHDAATSGHAKADKKAQDHDHDHDHAHDADHGHADLEANITFHCENAKALQQIDVQLFKGFHTINTINVQTALESQQTKQVLTAQSSVINLAK